MAFRPPSGGGSGDVEGPTPALSTDNAVVRWDGVTGKLIQDSVVTLSDVGVFVRDSGLLTLQTTTSGDLSILSAGEIIFDDVNKNGSTYLGSFKLSETSTEFDDYESNFGEVSLIDALNQCASTAVTLDEAYNNGSTITVDAGPVQLDVAAANQGLYVDAATINHTDTTGVIKFDIDSAADNVVGAINNFVVTGDFAMNVANKVSLTSGGMLSANDFNVTNWIGLNLSAADVANTTMAGHFTVLESSNTTSGSVLGMGSLMSDLIPVAVNYDGTSSVTGMFAFVKHVGGGAGNATGQQLQVAVDTNPIGSLIGLSIQLQPDIAGIGGIIGVNTQNVGTQTGSVGYSLSGDWLTAITATGAYTNGLILSGTYTTAMRTESGSIDFNFGGAEGITFDGSTVTRGAGVNLIDVDMSAGGGGNDRAIDVSTKMVADVNNTVAINNVIDATGIGMANGFSTTAYSANLTGDGADTSHVYKGMYMAANKNAGTSTMTAIDIASTDWDNSISTTSGSVTFGFQPTQSMYLKANAPSSNTTGSLNIDTDSSVSPAYSIYVTHQTSTDLSSNVGIYAEVEGQTAGTLGNILKVFSSMPIGFATDTNREYVAYAAEVFADKGGAGVAYGLYVDDGYDLDIYLTGSSPEISGKASLTLSTQNATADITIDSGREIAFTDVNKTGSTYSGTFKLSETSVEFDTFETNFGEVSLINSVNQAYAYALAFDTLNECYNGPSGSGSGRTINANDGTVLIQVADTSSNPALSLTQNDSTNNPVVLSISNAGIGADIYFNADGYIYAASGDLLLENATSGDINIKPFANITLGDGGSTNYIEVDSTGDVTFKGGAGLQFAQIYEEDGSSTLALAAQDTFYQVTAFTVNGESNGATPDHTNDHITVAEDGKYLVEISIDFAQTTAVSIEYDFHVQKNNGATDFPATSAHRDTAGSMVIGHTGGVGIIDLTANDTVELWVERLTGAAVSRTIVFSKVSLVLTQIGG